MARHLTAATISVEAEAEGEALARALEFCEVAERLGMGWCFLDQDGPPRLDDFDAPEPRSAKGGGSR